MIARLTLLFGLLALVLAAVGLYGVTAYTRAAADAGDWHTHGAGCDARRCCRHGVARSDAADSGWTGDWDSCGDAVRAFMSISRSCMRWLGATLA